MSFLAQVDQFLFRYVGYPYMRATRDDSSFDRVFYLLRFLREQNSRVRLLDAGCSGAISLYMIEREAPELVSSFVGLDWRASRLYPRYEHFRTPHEFFDTNLDDDREYGEFDLVWCSECLEHIVDDHSVFQRLCRSVKRGGHILISVPSEAHRKNRGAALPELLVTSPTQDGGHVRLGYTPESLRGLASGTSAELVRVDAITRAGEAYLRRGYRTSRKLRPLRITYDAIARPKSDYYKLSATASDLEEFASIAAVYRVG